jgi:hypothetical protein
MFRLKNVLVLIFTLVSHVATDTNYFLLPGKVMQASVQSIFLRCLWHSPIERFHSTLAYLVATVIYEHKMNMKSTPGR